MSRCARDDHGQRKLLIQARIRARDGAEFPVRVLVDTGSEVNLIKRGIMGSNYWHEPPRRVILSAVNQQDLGGHHKEFTG